MVSNFYITVHNALEYGCFFMASNLVLDKVTLPLSSISQSFFHTLTLITLPYANRGFNKSHPLSTGQPHFPFANLEFADTPPFHESLTQAVRCHAECVSLCCSIYSLAETCCALYQSTVSVGSESLRDNSKAINLSCSRLEACGLLW